MHQTRNSTLDVIKLLASYMVVFIHVMFYGKIGSAIDSLARFSVPLFFLVSGFYSYKTTPDKIKYRICHLLQLLLLGGAVYTCCHVLSFILKDNMQNIFSYFSAYIIPKNLLKLFILNVPIHVTHLWYLWAAIYVYGLAFFMEIYKIPEKLVYILSAIALLLHLFVGELFSALNITIPVPLVRNFALMGFPFFVLGMLCKKYSHKFINISNSMIVVLFVFGSFETILSRYFWGKNELYLGSIFMLASLTIVFIKFPNIKCPQFLLSLTSCSTYIYIFHPLFSSIVREVYAFVGFDYSSVALQMIHPLLTCVLTTIFAYILVRITHVFKN